MRDKVRRKDDARSNHSHKIPKDRDIVAYCSCPNEVTSARVARVFQRKGFTRIRPLLGGIEAWRGQNYPMEYRRKFCPGLPPA